jgi:pilus assembly protein CpaB
METRRIVLALGVALALSVGATLFLYRGILNRPAQPQVKKVVAASKPLDAGSVLTADTLVLIDWPANLPSESTFEKTEDVVGRSLIYPAADKQPIRKQALAAPGSGIGLTTKIPMGMRGISVKSNEVVGVAGFLYPGSHVDVLVSYHKQTTQDQVTQIVLQDVEVLTAGQKLEPDPQGKPETVTVVTVLLTPQDSAKLVLATQMGTIQFVLRNGADNTKAPPFSVETVQLASGEVPLKPTGVRAKPKPVNFYEVETISGDKRSTEKFQTPVQTPVQTPK